MLDMEKLQCSEPSSSSSMRCSSPIIKRSDTNSTSSERTNCGTKMWKLCTQ